MSAEQYCMFYPMNQIGKSIEKVKLSARALFLVSIWSTGQSAERAHSWFMIHAVFERETSSDVWRWEGFSEGAMSVQVWLRKVIFFLVCGLQFKLCLFQFWPLWSVKLLLTTPKFTLFHFISCEPDMSVGGPVEGLACFLLYSQWTVLDQMWWAASLFFFRW